MAPQGSVLGPMAEVVFRSTQHLSDADARAMAVYLQALPQHFQLAEKVEHRALPDCRLIQQVYCKLKETAVQ